MCHKHVQQYFLSSKNAKAFLNAVSSLLHHASTIACPSNSRRWQLELIETRFLYVTAIFTYPVLPISASTRNWEFYRPIKVSYIFESLAVQWRSHRRFRLKSKCNWYSVQSQLHSQPFPSPHQRIHKMWPSFCWIRRRKIAMKVTSHQSLACTNAIHLNS